MTELAARQRALRLVGSLLLFASASACIVSLVDTAGLVSRYQGGRPRDIGYAWLAHLIVLALESELFTGLPAVFSRYYELSGAADLLRFLAPAILLNLALAWLFSLVIAPLVLLIGRLPGNRKASSVLEWRGGWLLALWLMLLGPAVLHFSLEMTMLGLQRLEYAERIWGGLAALAVLWLLLAWPASHIRAFPRVARISSQVFLAAGVLVLLAGGVLDLVTGGPETTVAAAPGSPNVLLVSIDSLRADHLHCYGYERETSPILDALAAKGARFRYAVAPTSWTLPSHVTMLTSLPPTQHRVTADLTRLSPDAVTLAEVFKAAGYRTAGFVSGPYLRAEYGHRQGFDHYDDYSAMPLVWNAHKKVTSPPLYRIVKDWIEEWSGEGQREPFFIFLHMWDVHYDYNAPSPYGEMFDPDYTGSITSRNFETNSAIRKGMNPRDLAHIVAEYDGEIRYTDHYLGKLFDYLRGRGLYDNTVIAVTADHGEEFLEHGEKGHRKSLYDEVLLVPLIVRYPPKVAPGATVTEQVRLLDLGPTLLSLAGVKAPGSFGMQEGKPEEFGHDVSVFLDTQAEKRPPVPLAYGVLSWFLGSVRTNDWKLVIRVAGNPKPELYDLRADPGEHTNLASEETARLDEFYNQLMAFRRAGQDTQLVEKIEVDPEHLEALRTLGYITDYVEKAASTDVKMISPKPGSTLTEPAVTFRWEADGEVNQYYLKVGQAVNVGDVYEKDQALRTEATVTKIPLDGKPLYVRVFFRPGKKKWEHRDFTYQTGNAGGGR